MDIRTSEGAGHLAVRATGDLTVRTVPDLRDALLKAAAEQPLGLLCDLRQVRATRESLTILHVVADQVADWPASPLAVVAHDQVLLDQLDRLGVGRPPPAGRARRRPGGRGAAVLPALPAGLDPAGPQRGRARASPGLHRRAPAPMAGG